MREMSKFESEEERRKENKREKRKKISIHKSKNLGNESPMKSKFGGQTLVESETLQSDESGNILIKGLTLKKEEKESEKTERERKGERKRHRDRVTAEYHMKENGGEEGKKKNDFFDKELIEKLRNEPSSDE